MKFAGDNVLDAPVERVWDALLDPAVLVRTIPGCSRLQATGEHSYDLTVTAGVAAIKGTYAGTCRLHDLQEHRSLRMVLQGAGAPGTIGADIAVVFADAGNGTTRVTYDADAVVGGMVGGVGQRMLTSVSRRMAGEFFGNVAAALEGTSGTGAFAAPPEPGMPAVYTDVRSGGSDSSRTDFLTGIAVGAGLVLLGVLLGRRR
jgi:carbon monoxide dehydrogenase subunit G